MTSTTPLPSGIPHVEVKRSQRKPSKSSRKKRIVRLKEEVAGLTTKYTALTTRLRAVLSTSTPVSLDYACQMTGMGLAGFSLAYNGERGGDLAFPIVFPVKGESASYLLTPQDDRSHAIVHPLKKGPPRLGFFMADSMGHDEISGVHAAMVYQAARLGVQYELEQHDDVSSGLARKLNDAFYHGAPSSSPTSLLLARFDKRDEKNVKGSFISAGNPFPVILRAGSSQFERFDLGKAHVSAPIGLEPTHAENTYMPNKFELHPGDVMVLYSDGLSDLGCSLKKSKPYFPSTFDVAHTNHFLNLLLANRTRSANHIADALLEDVVTYATREDDVTAYVFKNEA